MVPLKLGVLLPTSRMFPRMEWDFLLGLRAALAECGLAHALIVEPLGNAAVPAFVTDKVQRLLIEHSPDVVVGVVGAVMIQHVRDLVVGARTPLIVNNLGAEPLLGTELPRDGIFHNSLNLWQSTHALGYWAARHVGPTACLAVGYHESGYGIVSAFWSGFASGGGTVLGTAVTHAASSDDDPSDALRALAEKQPHFIMGLYAGQSGVSFGRAYANLGLTGRIPLLASAMMLHDRWRAQMDGSVDGARTAFSWNRDRYAEDDTGFRRACAAVSDDEPDLFALLGYETGRALHGAAESVATRNVRGAAFSTALASTVFHSPRGTMRFDPQSGHVTSTDFLLSVERDGDSGSRLSTIAPLEISPSLHHDFESFQQQETRSGWTNPYMVT